MSENQPIKKTVHVKLTLSIDIEIDESHIPTTGAKARPNGTQRTGDDQAWREGDDMQRRLLRAVLADKEVFNEYIRFCVTNCVSGQQWQYWHELLRDVPNDHVESVLEPILQKLPAKDQELLQGASENGVFLENVEEFYDCWDDTIAEARIEIINP